MLLAIAASLSACASYETIPETGRRRPALQYTEAEMADIGKDAYRDVTKEYSVITGTDQAEMVTRVGQRVAKATGKDYAWEFKLLDAPETVNAFCLPGGKIAVFTGILKYTENEDGLAVILSHEVAHATLQHGNERMSQPALKRLIGLPVNLVTGVWGALAPRSRKLVMGSLGLGHIVGEFLPYSQEHETEADTVGIRYMQSAGYDLNEAPRFWERMAAAFPSESDPLSTHPDPSKRAKRLRGEIRELGAAAPAPAKPE